MATTQNHVLAKGYDAGEALTKKRFVKLNTSNEIEMCDTSGEEAYGVTLFSVSTAELALGKGASVLTQGRAILEAAEAIPTGSPVSTDNAGKAQVANSGDIILGMCDLGCDGAGDECSVDLSKRSGAAA